MGHCANNTLDSFRKRLRIHCSSIHTHLILPPTLRPGVDPSLSTSSSFSLSSSLPFIPHIDLQVIRTPGCRLHWFSQVSCCAAWHMATNKPMYWSLPTRPQNTILNHWGMRCNEAAPSPHKIHMDIALQARTQIYILSWVSLLPFWTQVYHDIYTHLLSDRITLHFAD